MLERKKELATNLAAVNKRIEDAVAEGQQTPTLIVVTKFFPASDVQILQDLGVQDVAENREQEATPKASEVAELGQTWHFIGQLQTNKARNVVRYASAVHSADRVSLVRALDKAKARFSEELEALDPYKLRQKKLRVLIQVDVDPAAGLDPDKPRGGALPSEVDQIAAEIEDSEWLELKGIMSVAPLQMDAGEAFERVQHIHQRLQEKYPQAGWRSIGMSHDLEKAVQYGATHLRIGSDVLGARPPIR